MNTDYDPKNDIYYRLLQKLLGAYKIGAVVLIVSAFCLLIVNFSPNLWYYIDGGAVSADTKTLVGTVEAEKLVSTVKTSAQNYSAAKALPPVDTSLPKEMTLIIPSIGVNAKIHLGKDGEKELEKGVWQPPSLGNPLSNNPMLLASHRYGYLSWSNDFRTKNSFYNLPRLNPGDEIIIAYQQRAFKYKITKKYEDDKIIAPNTDMVLYTCKFFRSSERIIVLADKAW
jgi:sortase (surface protein transpeptidase)